MSSAIADLQSQSGAPGKAKDRRAREITQIFAGLHVASGMIALWTAIALLSFTERKIIVCNAISNQLMQQALFISKSPNDQMEIQSKPPHPRSSAPRSKYW